MEAFDKGIFQPTEIVLHDQQVKEFGDVQIVNHFDPNLVRFLVNRKIHE